jgi:hypothetical protein
MLSRNVFIIFCGIVSLLTSCMKEIDGPLDIPLSSYPKIELNLEQVNKYRAKVYYNIASKTIVKTSDSRSWHIAFSSNPLNNNKVIMNYAFGASTWGATLQDTVWSRTLTLAQLESQTKIYANHYDSFANLFTRGINNVYYLYYEANLILPSKKFQILSYTNTEVSFRYANIDGSDEVTKTILLNPNTNFTYLSLLDGSIQDIEPADKQSWDFEVTHHTSYITYLSPPQMYAVGGFISNPSKNIGVAVLESINLENISEASLATFNYSSDLTAIGHDWKRFSNGGSDGFYSILPRSYIVKVDNKTYGIQFVSYTKTIDGKPFNGYPLFLQRDF